LTMQILMISDVHYSERPFHGQDQSKVFEWLYKVVEKEKPELLVSAGDFGEATQEMFQPICAKTKILTVYGNHDNLQLVKSLKNQDGSDCLLQDGVIREFDGIRIAGINGNISDRKRRPHHKTINEVEEIILRYAKSGKVDILVTHEVPKHPLLGKEKPFGFDIFNDAVKELSPKIYICGHVHLESQMIQMNETRLINIDSSARQREYAKCIYEKGQFKELELLIKRY